MSSMQKKRSFWLKFLAFTLLILSLTGWLRLYQSFYQWQWLVELGVNPGPLYTAVSGAVSGLAAGVGAAALWLHLSWSKRYIQICVLVLMAASWLEYLLFTRTDAGFADLPFRLISSILYLGFVYLYLQLTPPIKQMENKHEKPN